MKIITAFALAAMFTLSACQSTPKTTLTRDVYIPVSIPQALFNCPQVVKSQIPNPKTATNEEVAKFIALLYRYNRECGISIAKIKKYQEEAIRLIQERNKP